MYVQQETTVRDERHVPPLRARDAPILTAWSADVNRCRDALIGELVW